MAVATTAVVGTTMGTAAIRTGGMVIAITDTAITDTAITVTTIMVFVMVAASSVFFLVADQIIRIVITFILGVAG